MSDDRKIWLVEFPTYIYNEDVKKLARKNDLKVIDARFADQFSADDVETKPPKLTVKPEFKKAEPEKEG